MQIRKGRTHTSTCSHFARGLLFRNGGGDAISWRFLSPSLSSCLLTDLRRETKKRRKRERVDRKKKASKKNENERHHPFAVARTRILWLLSGNGRFPLKSASHGGSFTNFATKLYTTGVGRETGVCHPY